MSEKTNEEIKDVNEGAQATDNAEDTNNTEATEATETAEATEDGAEAAAEEPKELTVEEKLAQAEAQIEELKKQALYKQAEFDNFRKRVMKEKAELVLNGGTRVITNLLPFIDDLERADKNMESLEDVAAVKEGVTLIIDKFLKILAKEGLQKIDAVGKDFDTDFHEAIAMVPGLPEDQKNKVIDCVECGYTLNGNVIRHSKVAVAQ
jgi:molecular chaperone GrpE